MHGDDKVNVNLAPLIDNPSISEMDFSTLEPSFFQRSTELAADEVFWMWPDSSIFYVNKSACAKLGYRREELLGMKVWEWDPLFPKEVWPDFWQSLVDKKHLVFETQHITKEGHVFPVEIQGHYVLESGKEFLIAFVTDLSDRKQKEEEIARYQTNLENILEERTRDLKDQKERAEHASRVKSQFLANMSHEIRTPMNGVIGMVNQLLKTRMSPEQQHSVTAIKSCANSLMGIINDILDLSKIEAGKLEVERVAFNMNDVVNDVVVIAATLASQKKLAFSLNLGEEISHYANYSGDSSRLRQVLLNLLGNAIKFTEKGKVSLHVSLQEKIGDRFRCRFDIYDTGIGVDEKAKQHVFDAFSQADDSMSRKFGGTGLGLSISKQLISLMGGEMGFTSEKGQGSHFWFELPLMASFDSQERVENEHKTDNDTVTFHGARALLVEDNEINRDVAVMDLEYAGLTVECAAHGEEALAMVAKHRYDIIFMDCQMPIMDGYTATKKMRETKSGVSLPIIALTANAMQGERKKCLEAGMTDYLSKPFEYADILCALEKYIPQFKR